MWWPIALAWSVAVVVRRAAGREWHAQGVAVLVLGVAAAYSLDRLLDAPRGLPRAVRVLLAGATVVAGAGILWLLPALPAGSAAVVPLAAALAAAYPWLKRVPAAKTLAVPAVWTWCGVGFVVPDGSWLAWRAVQAPVALPLFLLIAAGCVLCDLKDEARDRAAAVPSVPVLLGGAAAVRVAVVLTVVAALAAVVEGRTALAWTSLALGVVAARPALVAADVIGPLLVDVVLTLPGVLITTHVV